MISQIAAHSPIGGMVPEIAARAHIEDRRRAGGARARRAPASAGELDGVAAAAGPGLIGGVLVGLMTGKGVALATGKPFLAINHLEAHALVARLAGGLSFPYLLLLASGGHTQILAVKGVGDYVRLGATMDDAIGEAFDKTAKLLGLALSRRPGGRSGGARGRSDPAFPCPVRCSGRPSADFSLSGLKTATRLAAQRSRRSKSRDIADLCASFQAAIVDVIEDRMRVGLRLFRERVGAAQAVVDRRRRRRQRRDPRGDDALLRAKRAAADRAAGQAVHRQRRDDRLGGHRAAAPRPRSTTSPPPAHPAGRSTRSAERALNNKA